MRRLAFTLACTAFLVGCRQPQQPAGPRVVVAQTPEPVAPRAEAKPFTVAAATTLPTRSMTAAAAPAAPAPGFLGWVTNGPAVFARFYTADRASATDEFGCPFVPPRPAATEEQATNRYSFSHYLPDSLNHLIWTNLIARTNGRTTRIWKDVRHSPEWPATPPVIIRDPSCLIRDFRGLTALSACWEGEISHGQIPITALTRRHGYARGHSMGPDGFGTRFAGKKVWFLTEASRLVEVKIAAEVVRTAKTGERVDYTIFLFDRDLPPSIDLPAVADGVEAFKKLGMPRLPFSAVVPRPILMTGQTGHVNASIPGFIVRVGQGGDSGAPSLLPLPGQLVFLGGATTTGPTPGMQADMDALCRQARLNPDLYRLRWADLSGYPTY